MTNERILWTYHRLTNEIMDAESALDRATTRAETVRCMNRVSTLRQQLDHCRHQLG